MRIGVDVSVLQTGHRKRGVGYTLINFINHLPTEAKQKHTFVFFVYDQDTDYDDPLPLLQLSDVSFEVRTIQPVRKSTIKLPGKLRLINNVLNFLRLRRDAYFGDSRIKAVKDLDWFFQFDQNHPLPPRHKVSSTLILYDLIQYIMEPEYLPSYSTARAKGHSRKGALRLHLRRRSYINKLRTTTNRAKRLVAISQHTKADFVRVLKIKPRKISVALLGVEPIEASSAKTSPAFHEYVHTSWGYLPRPVQIKSKQFLLFVGGADPRRKLVDLVAAFNNLRAQGHDIDLVLAGDTMLGAFKVPHVELQAYLKQTSYLNNIHFVGFVDDVQRDWLYQNAIAFVYPSVYEGFGLPVLEAMQYGTPVITYKNTSIEEVGGKGAIYAKNYLDIVRHIQALSEKGLTSKQKRQAQNTVKKFAWKKTAAAIIETVS